MTNDKNNLFAILMKYILLLSSILVIVIAVIFSKYCNKYFYFYLHGHPNNTNSTTVSSDDGGSSRKPYEIFGTHYSPLIDENNSSLVTQKKFNHVKAEYEEVLQSSEKKWIVMRTSENVTIERSATAYGGPSYLKTTAHFQVPPQSLIQLFYWQNFYRTQSVIDPFFESADQIFNVSYNCRVIKKTTKRPLVFPKRVFYMASCEHTQAQGVEIFIHSAWNTLVRRTTCGLSAPIGDHSRSFEEQNKLKVSIDKGTIVSSLMSVTLPNDEDILGYVRSFQDFIAWFLDDGTGGTLLVILMRVDLGPDIPNWAFLTTVAATGVWSMHAMMKLSRNFPYVNNSLPVDSSKMKPNSTSTGRGWHRKLLDKVFRPK